MNRIAGCGYSSGKTSQPRASRPFAIAKMSSAGSVAVYPNTVIAGLPMTSSPGIALMPALKRSM